jgi:hypothetical protein
MGQAAGCRGSHLARLSGLALARFTLRNAVPASREFSREGAYRYRARAIHRVQKLL